VLLDQNNQVVLDAVIQGDTVREVLDYVQFKSAIMVEQFRRSVEAAVRDGRIGYEESGALVKFYEEGLNGYTYLEQ
jgi:arginine decarboxylase